MKTTEVARAINAAKRFIAAANLVKPYTNWEGVILPGDGVEGGKDAAAAKRASLDLTRALAEMRKS